MKLKNILYALLSPTLGRKSFRRLYMLASSVSFVGLNYRNTNIKTNGELYFINKIGQYFKRKGNPVVLFDVGANIGNYSILLDEVLKGQEKKIYAFEPFSVPFSELKKKEEIIKDFSPYLLGFSEKKEKVKFLTTTAFSEVSSLYNKDFSQYNFSLDKSEELEFDSIDNFCKEHHIDKIDFLKVDVEGHDFFVLKGAKGLIDNNEIDFIQFEYGAANHLSKTFLYDFFQLLSPNYRIFRLLRNGFAEIKVYNTDIEIHILSNYIAINKNIDIPL